MPDRRGYHLAEDGCNRAGRPTIRRGHGTITHEGPLRGISARLVFGGNARSLIIVVADIRVEDGWISRLNARAR